MDNKNTHEDPLKSIAAPKFGLQSATVYYRDISNRYQKISLEALLK